MELRRLGRMGDKLVSATGVRGPSDRRLTKAAYANRKTMGIKTCLKKLLENSMTAGDAKGFRWGLERRLEFIEFRLFWEGGINRSDIVKEFGVSVPQASKDLTLYQEQAPDNIRYDRSEKRYFASESFQPKFIELDAAAYLERLTPSAHPNCADIDKVGAGNLSADKLPIPQRRIRADVLRALLASARGGRSIEILYQSMSANRPEPLWRRISPHAFGSDGFRWHVRAYCHIDEKFKDFILSRCLDTRAPDRAARVASEDKLWNTDFSVLLTSKSASKRKSARNHRARLCYGGRTYCCTGSSGIALLF